MLICLKFDTNTNLHFYGQQHPEVQHQSPGQRHREDPRPVHQGGHNQFHHRQRHPRRQLPLHRGRRQAQDPQLPGQQPPVPRPYPLVRRESGRLQPVLLHPGRVERPLRHSPFLHRLPRPLRRDSDIRTALLLFHQGRTAPGKLSRVHPAQGSRGVQEDHRLHLRGHGRAGVLRHL